MARSERGSEGDCRLDWRATGVSGRGIGSFDAEADCEDIFEVASAFSRGCRRDMPFQGAKAAIVATT